MNATALLLALIAALAPAPATTPTGSAATTTVLLATPASTATPALPAPTSASTQLAAPAHIAASTQLAEPDFIAAPALPAPTSASTQLAAPAHIAAPASNSEPASSAELGSVTAPSSLATGSIGPAAVICNRYCDARDPALSPSDRLPVSATVWGRQIVLHLNDTDAMGWGAVENGNPGDRVWVDRSFNAGRTWEGLLGDTAIPAGRRGWRTPMYNNDDWANRGVGALRACGKAGDRPEIACTAWARTTWNAGNRRTAAATALMMYYNQGTGLFDTTGWWNSANALTAIIENIRVTGMSSYRYAISNTYDRRGGVFTNEYIDDTGWWAMAWIGAYDLTGEARYLNAARANAEHMFRYWDGTCGGGVWWSTARTYKNAISNSLYVQVNAALARRVSGASPYLARARDGWAWFERTRMINGSNLVNDGISLNTCVNNGSTAWTYNQGVLVAGLTELWRATGDAALLTRARQIGTAASTASSLHSNGILREPCESGDCGADGPSFKGAHVRGLASLNAVLADRPFTTYVQRQSDAAYSSDRTSLDMYGLRWYGPVDRADAARQQSALDLLNTSTG